MTQRTHTARLGHYSARRVERRQGAILRFEGSCLRSGRPVTIVVLDRDQDGAREDEAAFSREQKVLTTVEHENVQRILDAGLVTASVASTLNVGIGSPYFVAQQPSGCSLADQADPRSWGELTRIVEGGLAALDAIHESGFVHGAVSPETVYRGEPDRTGGGVVLAGFSHTAPVGERPSAKSSGSFAAPEIRVGGAVPATVGMDLFSFGCVLYTFCSGKAPFGDGEATSSPRAFTPRFRMDPGCFLWLSRLLATEPHRRFQSARMALRSWQQLSANKQVRHLRETREELVAPNTGDFMTAHDSSSGIH